VVSWRAVYVCVYNRKHAVYVDGELHVGADDASFTRFNLMMVQQYFREEAVHQQHKVQYAHYYLLTSVSKS